MNKINIFDKMDLINEYWTPKIIGDVNDSFVKLAKFKGEFTWHKHDDEDEMFYVIKGNLTIKFRDKDIHLSDNECLVIPKGVEHMPCCDEEVYVMLVEAKSTLNTGDVVNDKTVVNLDEI